MTAIEQELIDVTSFEPAREYSERQDYLAALARATNKISDVDFNTLSNEAADWFNDAVKAIRDKKDIPDFPDREDDGEEPEPVAEAKPKKAKPERRPKGVPPRKMEHPPIDVDHSGEFETDRYGVVKGSKNAAAVVLMEKGCRMSDITASIGGTYYNLVARLQKQGHKIEKAANGMMKLSHKDD